VRAARERGPLHRDAGGPGAEAGLGVEHDALRAQRASDHALRAREVEVVQRRSAERLRDAGVGAHGGRTAAEVPLRADGRRHARAGAADRVGPDSRRRAPHAARRRPTCPWRTRGREPSAARGRTRARPSVPAPARTLHAPSARAASTSPEAEAAAKPLAAAGDRRTGSGRGERPPTRSTRPAAPPPARRRELCGPGPRRMRGRWRVPPSRVLPRCRGRRTARAAAGPRRRATPAARRRSRAARRCRARCPPRGSRTRSRCAPCGARRPPASGRRRAAPSPLPRAARGRTRPRWPRRVDVRRSSARARRRMRPVRHRARRPGSAVIAPIAASGTSERSARPVAGSLSGRPSSVTTTCSGRAPRSVTTVLPCAERAATKGSVATASLSVAAPSRRASATSRVAARRAASAARPAATCTGARRATRGAAAGERATTNPSAASTRPTSTTRASAPYPMRRTRSVSPGAARTRKSPAALVRDVSRGPITNANATGDPFVASTTRPRTTGCAAQGAASAARATAPATRPPARVVAASLTAGPRCGAGRAPGRPPRGRA
jgi:hypothetical protein